MAVLIRLICRTRPGGAVDLQKLKKVLLIRVDPRVGDVLLTTPLLRALKKGMPETRVDFLVAAGKEKLVEGLADRILTFRKKDFFRHPVRFWSTVLKIRSERYDAVIDASHWHTVSFTSAALAYFSGAPVRVGHLRGRSELFLTHPVPKNPANDREVPSKLELLTPFGLETAGEAMETTVDSVGQKLLNDPGEKFPEAADGHLPLSKALQDALGGLDYIAFNPGARKADRRWSPEGFGRLASCLAECTGLVPLILWGPGEEKIADEAAAASGGKAVLAPPTDLAMLAACFRRSRLVITNDTGPMHLAVAAGARVLAVFTFEDGPRWAPETGPYFQGVCVNGTDDLSMEAMDRLTSAAEELIGGKAASSV